MLINQGYVMQTSIKASSKQQRQFPSFDLARLLRTIFSPKRGEKACILIDLKDPAGITNFEYLEQDGLPVQKKAYNIFYQGLRNGLMQELGLKTCDIFAYEMTGGSNLELPETATNPQGQVVRFEREIYPIYDIILCITDFSATAPLTATSKKFGFRGATMHGMNDIILKSGLAVDYNEVSNQTEQLRQGMTGADSVDIDFEVENQKDHLHIELGKQEAQKSHGLCPTGGDIANLPAGEVYFVPQDAHGSFPIKLEDGTIGRMLVKGGRVGRITLIRGDQNVINEFQAKLESDPATGLLGELGFGTQVYPYANADIQDEKIFGTFHIATGRNDHLKGEITLDRFNNWRNASHDDILFSSTKTPEIHIKQVRMQRNGKTEVLIEDYQPSAYLLSLVKE